MRVYKTLITLLTLGKKKEKRVHIFFSQTRSPGKKRVDVRVSRVACPYHSWNPLLFAWGFVAFTPQTSWKLGAAEHPHRLAHTHTRSLAHSHTHILYTHTQNHALWIRVSCCNYTWPSAFWLPSIPQKRLEVDRAGRLVLVSRHHHAR